MNGERRLAATVQRNTHRSGRQEWVDRNTVGSQAKAAKLIEDLAAQGILADPRHDQCLRPEGVGVIGEVCRGAAQLFAGRQEVPKNFTYADDERSAFGCRFRVHDVSKITQSKLKNSSPLSI